MTSPLNLSGWQIARNQQLHNGSKLTMALAKVIGVACLMLLICAQPSQSEQGGENILPAASGFPQKSPNQTSVAGENLVAVAASHRSFSTLIKVVEAAGLTQLLSNNGPYTLFAPTDAAFAALPNSTWQKLLNPAYKQELVKVLTYHIVPGYLTSSKLRTSKVQTLEGSLLNLEVESQNFQIRVGKAKVVQANIPATNGVIYAINKVLLPPKLKLNRS